MTSAKAKKLKESFNADFSLIFQLCEYIMANSVKESLLVCTFQTLLKFLNWIPLGYIFETQLVKTLVYKFLPQPAFRNDVLACLTEIGSLDIGTICTQQRSSSSSAAAAQQQRSSAAAQQRQQQQQRSSSGSSVDGAAQAAIGAAAARLPPLFGRRPALAMRTPPSPFRRRQGGATCNPHNAECPHRMRTHRKFWNNARGGRPTAAPIGPIGPAAARLLSRRASRGGCPACLISVAPPLTSSSSSCPLCAHRRVADG